MYSELLFINFQVWALTLEISSHQENIGDDVLLQFVPQVAFHQFLDPDLRNQMNPDPTG